MPLLHRLHLWLRPDPGWGSPYATGWPKKRERDREKGYKQLIKSRQKQKVMKRKKERQKDRKTERKKRKKKENSQRQGYVKGTQEPIERAPDGYS